MQPRVLSSSGIAYRQTKKVPFRFTSITRSQVSSETSAAAPSTQTPAELTRTSSRPAVDTAPRTRRAQSSTLLTSPGAAKSRSPAPPACSPPPAWAERPRAGQLGQSRPQPGPVRSSHEDSRALGVQQPHGSLADPTGTAGHQGHFAAELPHLPRLAPSRFRI